MVRREVELRQDGESGSHGEREWEGIFNPVRHPSPSLSPSVDASRLRLLSLLLRVHVQHDLVILNLKIQAFNHKVTRILILQSIILLTQPLSPAMLYDDTHHHAGAPHVPHPYAHNHCTRQLRSTMSPIFTFPRRRWRI